MKLTNQIARRYLFSRKSSNAINIITWVSIGGIGVGTAALILVLSVFNGLTTFIEGLFAAIDPDVKVIAARGQYFTHDDTLYNYLSGHPEVAAVTRTVEGRVWLEYVENQTIGTLKGVEPGFTLVNPLDTFVYRGNYTFASRNGIRQGVFGSVVAERLATDLANDARPVSISYIPQDVSEMSAQASIKSASVFPSGYFSIQKEYDEKYVVSDFGFVQELFGLETANQLSAYEIRLRDIGRAGKFSEELQDWAGERYLVQTWYQQHATLYRVMRNEKYISYLILVLMLAIAAINIVGSLYMIVLEKNRDIAVLKAIGAHEGLIRQVFQRTGLLVGGVGGGIGVLIALAVGLVQKYFGVVKLQGGESFRVKAFPIEMRVEDFVLVFFTVLILAGLASIYPSFRAARVRVVEGIRR
ncbi:MAG: FtsX-like permease family protein [Bacteroidia bacterium]